MTFFTDVSTANYALPSGGAGYSQTAVRGAFMSKAMRTLRWSSAPMAIIASGLAFTSPAAAQDACVTVAADQVNCADNGADATAPQTASGDNLVVTVANGFGVNTAGGPGLEVTATGSISLTGAGGTSAITGTTGLYVSNTGPGAVNVVTSGPVTGTTDEGIYAYNAGTNLTIDSRAGTVTGATHGIFASNYGSGTLTVTTANVTGNSARGVYAYNYGTDLTIDTSAGTVTGANDGISANNYGTGALSITTGNVTGTTRYGVYAANGGTSLTIDTSAGRVTGGTYGISATNYGTGALRITAADVMGGAGDGVYAYGAGTSVTIDTRAGSVSGGNSGINAYNGGSGALSITTANVSGTAGAGIAAANYGTDLTIDSRAGTVSGAGGVFASNYGTGALSITTANASGSTASGVSAFNAASGTNLSVDTSAGTVSGGSNGITATNNGTGSTAITAANVTGNGGAGIAARVGANSTGLTITTSGTVTGSLIGIDARNGSASATMIVNSGIISATSGEAIRSDNAANTAITNTGRILGFVTLGDGNDNLTNSGAFIASGNSNFGDGSDVLINSGKIAVQGTDSVTLTGLESFTNTGRIALHTGLSGTQLTIPGSFVGSGDSALFIDVDPAAGTADRLTIGGAATGSTNVNLLFTSALEQGLLSNIVIVDAGAGTSADAFTLVGGSQINGLLEFALNFDPLANDFLLSSAPSLAAYETTNFGEFTRNAWTQSANAFSDHMAMTRDTGTGDGVRGWVTGYGTILDRDRTESTTFNGVTSVRNLGYSQNSFGFLAGVDLGSDTVRYGVTGGYQNNEADFAGSSGDVSFDVFSIGGYIAVDFDAFWANALVKYDAISGDLENSAAGLAGDFDGSVFGFQAEAGALVGSRDGLFLEPRVSLAYADAELDDITVAQGSLAFGTGQSLRGKIGGRAGTGLDLGGRYGVVYVAGHYVREFEGSDTVTFRTGQTEAIFSNLPIGDYAELSTGITVGRKEDAFAASLQGTFIAGSDVEGYGGSINLRYQFHADGK